MLRLLLNRGVLAGCLCIVGTQYAQAQTKRDTPILEKYGISFVNRAVFDQNYKYGTAPQNSLGNYICVVLSNIRGEEEYEGSLLQEVTRAMSGETYEEFLSWEDGTEFTLTPTYVQVNESTRIPIDDFRLILLEWRQFWATPPLSGAAIAK